MHDLILHFSKGASLRGIERKEGINAGEWYFSVYDFIALVCNKRLTSSYASVLFCRLIADTSEYRRELLDLTTYIKFPGTGQRETPCMTMCGLQVLMQIMGGKVSSQYRKLVIEVFNRYMAGDLSMIQEIEAHAASNALIHDAYRRIIHKELPLSDCPEAKRRKELMGDKNARIEHFMHTQHHRVLSRFFHNDSLEFLGCSQDEFRAKMQQKMDCYNATLTDDAEERLTWINAHFDHIKPIASVPFGHMDSRVMHYTNIQPLLARQNLTKGAKWSAGDELFWEENIIHKSEWVQIYMPQ
jgi:hypothetical protein